MCLVALFVLPLQAAHILSGTINYEKISATEYNAQLVLYRNCSGGGAEFDQTIGIGIFQNGALFVTYQVELSSIEAIEPADYEDCSETLPNICTERGIYDFTFNWTFNNAPFSIVYQRCCWSHDLANVDSPGERGLTVEAEVSVAAQEQGNTSPFIDFPLAFVSCPGEQVSIPLDNFDAEGDSLGYEMCMPLQGGGLEGTVDAPGDPSGCNGVVPNPPCAGPYEVLPFAAGFDLSNPFPTLDGITFDPVNGTMEFVPTDVGRYVFGLCITEFRDGEIIGMYRDNLMLSDYAPTPVSVSNPQAIKAWSAYVNPMDKLLNLMRETASSEEAILHLYDLQGRALLQRPIATGTNSLQIEMNYPSGLYLLSVEGAEGKQLIKVFIP